MTEEEAGSLTEVVFYQLHFLSVWWIWSVIFNEGGVSKGLVKTELVAIYKSWNRFG